MWAVFNGGKPPAFTADELTAGAAASALPPALARTSPFLEHPVFNSHHSELQMPRYAFGRVSDTGALTTRPAPHLSPRSSLLPQALEKAATVHVRRGGRSDERVARSDGPGRRGGVSA